MTQSLGLVSNEELLKRYQHADLAAFYEFFKRNRGLIFHFLLSRLGNQAEAEEALQKTFLRIHRFILRYDSAQSALGWVITIAKHVAYDLRAQHIPFQPLEDIDPASHSCENEAALEARSALSSILQSLEVHDRRLLEKRLFLDESFEDIAKEEGWTVDNTRQKVSRLIRRLKSQFAEHSI